MFDRYSESARRVVALSRKHAVKHEHSWIGSVHVLLALLEESRGMAGKVLRETGLTLDYAAQAVRALTPPEGPAESDRLPFTPDSKALLKAAEVVAGDAAEVDTEHLLLGLVADVESAASRVLVALDADLERIKQAVYEQTRNKPARAANTAAGSDEVVAAAAIANLRTARDLIALLERADPDLRRASDLAQDALAELEQRLGS